MALRIDLKEPLPLAHTPAAPVAQGSPFLPCSSPMPVCVCVCVCLCVRAWCARVCDGADAVAPDLLHRGDLLLLRSFDVRDGSWRVSLNGEKLRARVHIDVVLE